MKEFAPKQILVIGGGHGLGLALSLRCLDHYPESRIHVTYRLKDKLEVIESSRIIRYQVDPLDEGQVRDFCNKNEYFDLVINCVGTLESSLHHGPEKSLRNINLEYMSEVFHVNAFVTPLWAKYLKEKFRKEDRSAFVTLSAMVGSIQENEIGGWYSYRASKTALNMFLKTISIEFKRSHLPTAVMAIHPGTTETDLSKNFLKNIKHKVWKPNDAAENILNVIEDNCDSNAFIFKNWDGRTIEF